MTRKKACVIGWPVGHSRSPLIHGYWLKLHGIDGSYEKCPVEPGAMCKLFLRKAQFFAAQTPKK